MRRFVPNLGNFQADFALNPARPVAVSADSVFFQQSDARAELHHEVRCANVYGSDAARFLIADSFHPGGLRLTRSFGIFT